MAKKKWLLHILKKLFLCEPGNPSDKETKRWGWIYGKSKKLKQLPEVSTTQSNLNDVREEHMKHVLNVARATAAAAEAAVAAAQAAAAVVRLTGMAQTAHQNHQRHNWAAVIIQTAFRGYLARKALRALKGVVRLQAIVRGRVVRRQLKFELKRSPSFTRLAQVRRARTSELGEAIRVGERQWNDNISTEEAESMSLRRQEAVNRRDRMKQYSFSHRERQLQYTQILEDPLFSRKYNERQWGGEKFYRSGFPPRMKQRIVPRLEDHIEEHTNSQNSNPRRSFSQMRERSSGEESVSTCSPSYMATTESSKARMRSMSTPRQRIRFLDQYYEHDGDCYMNIKPTWTAALNCEAMSSISSGAHQLKSLSVRSFKLP